MFQEIVKTARWRMLRHPHRGMEIELAAGPDAGRTVEVGIGRHLIGRAARAAVRIDDPAIEAHHVLLEVGHDAVVLTQLAGRFPISVDHGRHETGVVRAGAVVEMGASRLVVGRAARRERGWGDRSDRFTALAQVERDAYLARGHSPWVVKLGHGTVQLPLPVAADRLELPEQVALAAAELHHDQPVLVNLAIGRRFVLAVRGEHADRVIAAIVRQLPPPSADSGRRSWTVSSEPTGVADERPAVVLAPVEPRRELPPGCDALVELGPNWRATFTPDLCRPGLKVRFHAAGYSAGSGSSGELGAGGEAKIA